jgi:pimeloyl-ACP methyl ester carboxylesterase
LHGFSFDMTAWDDQMDELSRHHQVIRYDLRGFGRSSVPYQTYDHAEDLQRLIATLGIERPTLVGLSLGANVALGYALDHPHAVRALILASPGLPGALWKEERPPDAAMAYSRTHSIEETKQYWLAHPLFEPTRRVERAFERVRRMVAAYSGWHWRHSNPLRPACLLDRLAGCQVPTLVMSGDLDVTGYRLIARQIVESVPHADLMTIPTAGHILNDESPDAFLTGVTEFASLPTGQS